MVIIQVYGCEKDSQKARVIKQRLKNIIENEKSLSKNIDYTLTIIPSRVEKLFTDASSFYVHILVESIRIHVAKTIVEKLTQFGIAVSYNIYRVYPGNKPLLE